MASAAGTSAHLFGEPVPLYREPSQESSPPPSPGRRRLSDSSHHADAMTSQPSARTLPFSSVPSSKLLSLDTNIAPVLGRQETPPSPPNSVLAGEAEDGVSPNSSITPVDGTEPKSAQQNRESSAASLRDKFSRVFSRSGHKRAGSDHSWSNVRGGIGRHRKDNSTSTNTTANPLALTRIQTASSKTSIQSEPEAAVTGKQGFYSQEGSTKNTSSDSVSQKGGKKSGGRRIMNGGEVRIEIIPHPSGPPEAENTSNGDGSAKYYDYYTRSKSSSPSQDQVSTIAFEGSLSLPSLNTPEPRPNAPARNETTGTYSSAESRERRYMEDSVAHNFEGIHLGLDNNDSIGQIDGAADQFDSSDTSSRPIHGTSASASSSVLPRNFSTRSNSSLARKNTNGSASMRPSLSRNLSSSSFIINGRTISPQNNGDLPCEGVTRELRRLSKISAGSGVSGLAIVVTADGPASTSRSIDYSVRENSEVHQPTAEEKGKGRAAPSELSEDQENSHTRSLSERSEWTQETRQSDDGRSDSKSLLPLGSEVVQSRKLRAQEPSKDVLIHQGDPRYQFTYRMRQTSDDARVFVPQYRYDSPLAFPNRNALGLPVPSGSPKMSDGTTFSSLSFGDRMGGSILKRPPSAMLRVENYDEMPQGDNTVDSRPRTSHTDHRGSMIVSRSHNDMDSLIHPALRSSPEKSGKPREVVSMTSLEVFRSSFRKDSFQELSRGHDTRSSGGQSTEEVRRSTYGNLLAPPSPAAAAAAHRRSSWDPSRLLNQFPARPKEFMRRSLTPHLYNAQDISLDDGKSDIELQGGSPGYIKRQKKNWSHASRCLPALPTIVVRHGMWRFRLFRCVLD